MMALAFPYTYISCPCSDTSRRRVRAGSSRPGSRDTEVVEGVDQEENSFDPRHARSAFSLYPPEHLLYCEECHDLKCPRCVKEEILCWYCPYCLFETPSSTVRNESNRCARNCFNCPICTSQLVTAPVGDNSTSGSGSSSSSSSKDGPFILNCNYCMWSTLDIGITFAQPTSIRAQLDKLANGGRPKPPSRVDSGGNSVTAIGADPARRSSLARAPLSPYSGADSGGVVNQTLSDAPEGDEKEEEEGRGGSKFPALDANARFTALRSFYKEQIASASASETGLPTAGLDLYSSPSSLARIMNLYSSVGSGAAGAGAGTGAGGGSLMKKTRSKITIMREAQTHSEGFQLSPPEPEPRRQAEGEEEEEEDDDDDYNDYIDTPSLSQLQQQHPCSLGNPTARSVSELRPIPALLRTKRSKRCAACSHILVRPEFKPTSTRYRIRLLALNYIPFVTLRPMPGSAGLFQQYQQQQHQQAAAIDGSSNVILEPGQASQWILTMRNPLYEKVNVTLGAEAMTPGRHRHRVTILCPEFEVGKSGDVWDDALDLGKTSASASASAAGPVVAADTGRGIAGKVYDKGRNWVSVVVEIVPSLIERRAKGGNGSGIDDGGEEEEEEDEDEDVVEVPIRVRLEWRQTEGEDGSGTGAAAAARRAASKKSTATSKASSRLLDEGEGDEEEDEAAMRDDGRREVAYWMVLGVGRVKT